MIGTPTRAVSAWPRRWSYPAAGVALAAGAPAGFLVLRAILAGRPPTPAWLAHEIETQSVAYVYLTISTTIVFVLLGRILGGKEDEIQKTSITDPLTGLVNRRHLLGRLADELARAARHQTPLSVLIVDLDGLKVINDRHGHQAGDVALRAVGEALRRACRATDLPARYGGDEFVVLAPMTSASKAIELAERVCNTVHTLGRESIGPRISVSIGVADIDRAGSTGPEALLAAADRALYEAKARGRDRVVAASHPRELTPKRALAVPKEGTHARH